MTFDFLTTYLIIATFYTIFSISFLVLEKEGYVDPIGLGIVSTIVAVFLGWLLFPILLFYNLVIRKTFI